MDSEDIYLSGEYLSNNPSYHIEDSNWKANKIKTLLDRNQKFIINSVCEVGCGAGGVIKGLSQLIDNSHISYTGYDISPNAIRIAITNNATNIKFFNEDFFKNNECYDLLLCIDVIEHIENLSQFLQGLKCRGNIKIFHIPLSINVVNIFRNNFVKERKQYGHIHYFDKDLALQVLIEQGYDVVDWMFTNGVECYLETHKNGKIINNVPIHIYNCLKKITFLINQNIGCKLFAQNSILILAK